MPEVREIKKSESTLMAELKDLVVKFQNDFKHRSFDYDELVEIFHTYMLELVNYSPLNLYNNPLSIFIKKHLGNEIPGCFMDEFKYYEDDNEFKSDLNDLIQYYKDIVESGFEISDSEFDELYKLSLVDEENESIFVRYLVSQLIEGNNTTSNRIYCDLIDRFVCDFVTKNGLNVRFRIGKLDNEDDDYADSIYKRRTYHVTFDRGHLNQRNILFNLEDIFHEIWYTVQDSEEYNNGDIIQLIKTDDFIRRVLGDSYYDDNYGIISYEVDANLHAVLMLASLLKEISPETYEVNKETFERRAARYNDLLYSRTRIYMGEKCDLDDVFTIALIEENKTREDVFGNLDGSKRHIKEMVF